MASRRKWLCLDCKVDTGKIGEHYMLIEETWQLAHKSNQGMLCVDCLESRIGRRLVASDFNDSHINRVKPGESKSQKLLDRISSTN